MPAKHVTIRDGSFVSDLYNALSHVNTNSQALLNYFGKEFSPKDANGKYQEVDGQVVGVQDAQPLFDKATPTTVHAPPKNGKEDKRTQEEKIVFDTLVKQLQHDPAPESYTLKSGIVTSDQGKGTSLRGEAALAAYAALLNDKATTMMDKYGPVLKTRNVLDKLLVKSEKNHITDAQSTTSRARLKTVLVHGTRPHVTIRGRVPQGV